MCVSELCGDKLCVSKLCVISGGRGQAGPGGARRGRAGPGGARRKCTTKKTRTPHKDVGKNQQKPSVFSRFGRRRDIGFACMCVYIYLKNIYMCVCACVFTFISFSQSFTYHIVVVTYCCIAV